MGKGKRRWSLERALEVALEAFDVSESTVKEWAIRRKPGVEPNWRQWLAAEYLVNEWEYWYEEGVDNGSIGEVPGTGGTQASRVDNGPGGGSED